MQHAIAGAKLGISPLAPPKLPERARVNADNTIRGAVSEDTRVTRVNQPSNETRLIKLPVFG